MSTRPSDAVALAIRTDAAVYARPRCSTPPVSSPSREADQEEEILDEFRDFIEHVSPDDFAG